MSDNTVVTENDLTSVVEVTSAGPAGPPGGALTIQDEGVDEGLLTDKINFAGSTVSVVNDTEAEIATVTVNAADPGANTNITSLGGITGGISSPDYVQFDTAAAAAGAVGRLLWNDTDGTLEFQLKGGNVTLQIGQEQVVRVTNTSGVTMTDGQAVYITGSTGNHLNVTLAQANAEATSSKTLAVVTETIANNNTGFATSSGLVRGLNTSTLTEGAAIWLSPTVPGGLTTTRPTAPDHAVLLGWCVRQSATVGAIFVHIANGYELDELHNVLITAAANNQVLRYDAATGLWKNTTISPTLTLTGDVSGSATFTDLGNATLTATVADDSHNHIIGNVDGLQAALDSKLAAASYTATDVLDKIKTVDGAGSGLDADLLDGQSSAYYTAINDRLGYTAENAANKGVAGGYASLDGAGLVPATQLPSYVDDVLEFANLAAFPATGESGKIYVAVDTAKTYRWSGSTYVEISASPGSTDAVPEGSTNLYFTTARARQSVSAGTGISYNSSTGVITNAAPDQTVAITGSGTTTVTGTYPNFTVSSADQYVGTVTSVSGTGTVNGLTLTGSVTSSGSLTLGGTLSVGLSTATVTGTLPVSKGGTGATTLTGLVKGNGTSAFTAASSADVITALGYTPANKAGDTFTGQITVPNQLAYDYTTSVLPDVAPALNLNFVQSGVVDPRITFTRSSTATFVGSNGLIQTAAVNAPRLDYDPVTLAPKGLLIEEQRTNLLVRSEEFDVASWTKGTFGAITAGAATAPDGTNTADALSANAATSTNPAEIYQATSQAINTQYAYSMFAKKNTSNFLALRHTAVSGNPYAWFDLNTGTVGTVQSGITATITPFGNGWYRCTVVGTTASSIGVNRVDAFVSDNNGNYVCASGGSIFVWGAQLEAGAFATSYIPTVASQVTRTADVASMGGANFSSWFAGATGTFYFEFDRFTYGVNLSYYGLSATDGASTNLVGFQNYGTGVYGKTFAGGVDTITLLGGSPAASAVVKAAAVYGAADYAISVNGAAAVTQSTGAAPVSLDRLNIGNFNGGSFLNGHIRSIQYYNTRLANTVLQGITA